MRCSGYSDISSSVNPSTAVPAYYRTFYARRIEDILHHDMPINILRMSRARIRAFLVNEDRKDLKTRFPESQITFQQSRNEGKSTQNPRERLSDASRNTLK
jgi:hypothetical protein